MGGVGGGGGAVLPTSHSVNQYTLRSFSVILTEFQYFQADLAYYSSIMPILKMHFQ